MKSEYDLYSAITFLMVGLGVGSVLAIIFNSKERVALEGGWRNAGLHPEEQAEERERIA
jgi:hypothetical protein